MSKDERRNELLREIEKAEIDESLKALCFTIFDRAYDGGFADGVAYGMEQSANLQTMIFDTRGLKPPGIHRRSLLRRATRR